LNPDANGIRDRMTHVEKLDPEIAGLNNAAGLHSLQVGAGHQAMACQFDFQQAAG
jgi:hypothetical protein